MSDESEPITSSYGNRLLCWHPDTLEMLLAELRGERQRHDTDMETEAGEDRHSAALLLQAEQIKEMSSHE
jgi:hypothetical protein